MAASMDSALSGWCHLEGHADHEVVTGRMASPNSPFGQGLAVQEDVVLLCGRTRRCRR